MKTLSSCGSYRCMHLAYAAEFFCPKSRRENTQVGVDLTNENEVARRVFPPYSLLLFGERSIHLFVQVDAPRLGGAQFVIPPARSELTRLADVDCTLVVRGVDVLDRVGSRVGFEFGVLVPLPEGA